MTRRERLEVIWAAARASDRYASLIRRLLFTIHYS
jgi:hypothetical protein